MRSASVSGVRGGRPGRRGGRADRAGSPMSEEVSRGTPRVGSSRSSKYRGVSWHKHRRMWQVSAHILPSCILPQTCLPSLAALSCLPKPLLSLADSVRDLIGVIDVRLCEHGDGCCRCTFMCSLRPRTATTSATLPMRLMRPRLMIEKSSRCDFAANGLCVQCGLCATAQHY